MTDHTNEKAQTALTRRFVCQACGASASTRPDVTPVRCHVCREGTFVERVIPPGKTTSDE